MNKELLITIDYKPDIGGVARYLDNYVKENSLDVLAPKNKIADIKSGVFRHTLLWSLWPKWLPLIFWGWFYGRKYERIIISHVLPSGYLFFFLNKPYTIILHGLDIVNISKSGRKRYFAKIILDKADKIIVNSEATGRLLQTIFRRVYNYQVRYPKVEKLSEPTKDFKKINNLEGRKVILSLGRLVKRKGQEKVIKLMPRILQVVENAVFVIAGEGPYKKELKKLVNDLRLSDSVIFLGKISEKELANVYSGCDIFVLTALPSNDNWEGFGMVCLEVDQFDKPVIVSNVGGLPEAVKQCKDGYVISTDEELEKILINLLS